MMRAKTLIFPLRKRSQNKDQTINSFFNLVGVKILEMHGCETINTASAAARGRMNCFSNILEDVRGSVGIGMISIFDGSGGCLNCRLSRTSGVMSHNMSSDATV